MKRTRTILAAAAALALTGGAAWAQDIQIAVVGPMTGSNAAFGEQMKRGAEQAVADINAKGGVLGKKLALSIGDDACDPKQAEAVAQQMASKKVVFVAGHFCSSSSIPASAVYSDADILQITPGSTNPALTDEAFKKKWINVFRVCGRDDDQGHVAGGYILSHYKGKAVAIVDDRSTYGKGLADETRKAINAGGIKEVMDESINAGDTDFSALVSKLKQAKVELIFLGGYQREAGLLVRQAREQGLKAQLMGGDALQTSEFWSITGPSGEDTLFTFGPNPEKKPDAQAVVAAIKKSGYEPEGYTLYSYAAIQIFSQAAEKAKSIKLADLAKALHSTTFNSVIGPISYDDKGDITAGGFVVWAWKNGNAGEL